MILDNKNGKLLNVKGNYCNEDIFVRLSDADFNALVSANIKKGITILGVTGSLESTTTTVCTCDVPTIDNLETPGENGKYYYYNGNIYVYNNGYKLLGETIPEVNVLPTTGQEGSLVYCNNVLHKYIDNDWKELSVLEDEITCTPTHSRQEFTNKKKVTVNGVNVPTITETEFNSPTVSKDTLVYYNQKIYICTEQADKRKQYVLYANKTERVFTVPEDKAILVSNAGLQKIALDDPQSGEVYGSIGDVYINVDVEGVVIYEASESLPDGEDGEIVKHGDSYKLWQNNQWNVLDIVSNAETYNVIFTKNGDTKTGLFNKIVIPGLPIVPVSELPEDATENDLVYYNGKIYIYKPNATIELNINGWIEYIKDTHTFDYVTNQTNYIVPNGLSAKSITINGLKPEEVTANVKALGTITPGFALQSYDASTETDLDGYSSFTIKAVPVVDDGGLPKNGDGTAKYDNLNEMRYFEGRIYKINSTTLQWEPYEGNVTTYNPGTIISNGPVTWTAPEGTTWNTVNFKVQVPSSGLIKDYTSLQSASGLVSTVGAIVHIPNKDDSGNVTWGTLYKRNEAGVWNPLTLPASVIQDIIEPGYSSTTIEAGEGAYVNIEAFKSLPIAGVHVINWTDSENLPDTSKVSVGQKIYMKNVSYSEGTVLPNGLINYTIYQRGMNDDNGPVWYPVKPLQDKTVTVQRNTDYIDIVYNDNYTADAQLYGMRKVRVNLEGEKTCEVIGTFNGTYDTNAPLTHIDSDIPTFTATATDDTPVQIHLEGKHIGKDIKINAYIPKINAIYTPENLSEHPVITAKELVSTSSIDNWTYKWWYADSVTGEYKEYDISDKYYKSNINNVIFNKVTIDLSKIKLTGITLEESTINNILLSRTGYEHTSSTGLYYTKVKIPHITIPDCTDLYDSNLTAPNGTRVCFTGTYNGKAYEKVVMKRVEDSSGGSWFPDTGNIQDIQEVVYTDNGVYNIGPADGYDATRNIKVTVATPEVQSNKTIEYGTNGTYTITPDTGYGSIKQITVNVNTPVPQGTLTVYANGIYDASKYEKVRVSVNENYSYGDKITAFDENNDIFILNLDYTRTPRVLIRVCTDSVYEHVFSIPDISMLQLNTYTRLNIGKMYIKDTRVDATSVYEAVLYVDSNYKLYLDNKIGFFTERASYVEFEFIE